MRTALETNFPVGVISRSAERESWRKEVHRPATHTHKWWAQRLGSVFRGILVAAMTPEGQDAHYGDLHAASDTVVLDPFAGSGTTLVEAVKLGCRVVGYDINPVASVVQRQALAKWDGWELCNAFDAVEAAVRPRIDALHLTASGETVLYYFWVAQARCPSCPADSKPVDLFSSLIFSRHAYAKKVPQARATCPECSSVVPVKVTDDGFNCPSCGWSGGFDGSVKGATMTCPAGHKTQVLRALGGQLPVMRMYAKMVLGRDGSKRYEGIDQYDLDLYKQAETLLQEVRDQLVLPTGALEQGINTRQAMSWGYREWSQFFNARQLVSLGLLGAAIRDLPESPEREALAALFSGVLEFNNLFCSFKGEGTGAVRHMFSHHILKPERVPLEAHPWGTPQSSGSFSTLFRSRILRAMEYKDKPHDLVAEERVFGISHKLSTSIVTRGCAFREGSAMVVAGNSATIDLPDSSVDLIVTDPPYFDNVHYSELADFFHAWLRELHPYPEYPSHSPTTRTTGEVQSADAGEFGDAIAAVWQECARVLKDDGLIAFTFHQARVEGWVALVKALKSAGLIVTAIQPVKGEMSVSSTKSGATDPSNLDSIVVCRKTDNGLRPTVEVSTKRLQEVADSGITVGVTDCHSVIRGSALAAYTWPENTASMEELVTVALADAESACEVMGVASRRLAGQR